MALALLTTDTHALLLCVLFSIRYQLSTSTTPAPECGAPKTVINAKVNFEEPSPETKWKFIRYICQDGYKRKPGTSNLAICMLDSDANKAYWKYTNISCIRDPSIPLTTHSTLTSSTTSRSQFTTVLPRTNLKLTVRPMTQEPRSSVHTATNDSDIPDTDNWLQGKTAGSLTGGLLTLTVLIIGIIIWIKRRKQHSPVPHEDPNPAHNSSGDHENQEEESCDL